MLQSLPRKIALFTLALSFASQAIMANDKTLPIAVAGPVTGPVAEYGAMQIQGSRLAIEHINKAGGVNGKKLTMVIYDDACSPKLAATVGNDIINDGIRFVVGHLCSSATGKVADLYERADVLMITPASTKPDITARGHRLIFRTIGLDSMQGAIAADYIIHTVTPRSMAVIHDQQPYGRVLAEIVHNTVRQAGIPVVLYDSINIGDKDFTGLIAQMKKSNVDFVYYGGYHPELGLLLRQSAEQGLDIAFMGPESVGNNDLSAIAGQAADGLLVTLPDDFAGKPANAKLSAAFQARGVDPTAPFVLTAYTAVQLLAEGMRRSGSEEPAKVADALRSNSFKTPMGQLAFNDMGDLKNFRFVVYRWHVDGRKTALSE